MQPIKAGSTNKRAVEWSQTTDGRDVLEEEENWDGWIIMDEAVEVEP